MEQRQFDALLRASPWMKDFLKDWKRAHTVVLGLVAGGIAEKDWENITERLRRAEADRSQHPYTRELARLVLSEMERDPPAEFWEPGAF